MDILGVGFPELVLIFIIAMMVFGPRRLPEIAAKIGKTVADLRNMSNGLLTEWRREIAVAARVEELEKTRQEFDQIKQDIKQTRDEVASETSAHVKELQETRRELEEATQESQRAPEEVPAETSSQPVENTNNPPAASPQPAPPATPPAEVTSE
jgi:sec-independent protein translocase protein TatA